ncbi:MAG: homoserine dehydrogenase [Rickettsiales bacterium]|nr:homoserine dehydrogenase [Rickettsiales bacterium]
MKKIRIGLAGLGTVGRGVYDILKKDAATLTKRSGVIFEITAVASRSNKDFVDSKIKFYSNVPDLANDTEVDVVVEVMGGVTTAKDLIWQAIKNGKKVVTANKALIAENGSELVELLQKYNGHIGFEASTAGANPVIKAFKESFTSSEITEFYAILNGTCNFILTKMGSEGSDFSETLKEAQKLGYAEADPTFDIEGIDTAHKLVILSSIASSTKPAFKKIHIEGISKVTIDDVNLAAELGYKIKLLAIYKNLGNSIQETVYPALVKVEEKVAQVDGPFNTILVNTSNASWNMSIGRGAGGLTTGSAIVADLVDIACNRSSDLFGVPAKELTESKIIDISNRQGCYFLSLILNKELVKTSSNLAEIIFADKIKPVKAAFIDKENEIVCGFITESQKESDVVTALSNIDKNLVKLAKFIRVEEIGF